MTRIDIRVDDAKKEVISKAAALLGQTVTQYVMSLVLPDAERRVAENHRIQLSPQDWEVFARRLDEAPQELPALKILLNRESRFQDG